MRSVYTFAPANISCIFTVEHNDDPRWMGSTGLGFTLNKGVVVEVSSSEKTEIFFNNTKLKFPTVLLVIKMLTKKHVRVRISSELLLGYGFGLSGASALATAYALNTLLKLKKTKKELAIIAHTADVKNKTGLGDVANQYFGGFFLKEKPSSYFMVKKIFLSNNYVYVKTFSSIKTKSILTNKKLVEKINREGKKAINTIQKLTKPILFSDLILLSKEFVKESGLLKDTKTKETIGQIEKNNGYASMLILGNGVFSDKPFSGSIRFAIGTKKAHLL